MSGSPEALRRWTSSTPWVLVTMEAVPTLHANSVRDALTRLAALVRRHPAQIRADPGAVAREIATKVDMVVHLSRFRDADGRDRRVLGALALVTGQVEGEIPVVEEVCRDHRPRGEWRWRISRFDDLPPKIADKFEGANIALNQVVARLGSASGRGL